MNKNNTIGYMICETASSEPQVLRPVKENSGILTLEAILQDMDVKNRNGRFYANSKMSAALKATRLTELLASRSLFGEAGHPMSSDIAVQQTINPKNMSHLITKLWTDKNDIKAYLEPAQTAVGDDFKRVVGTNTKAAFSLRALGSINNTARGAEVENIRIVTWDWVIFPSHQRAYMDKIINVSESTIMGLENHLICGSNDKGLMIPITNLSVEKYIKESSSNLKTVIESLELLYDNIQLSENGKYVILNSQEGKFKVFIESYITDEILNYSGRLR